MRKRLAILAAASCIPFLIACATTSPPRGAARAADAKESAAASRVERLKADGLLSDFELRENRALVDPIAWQALDLSTQFHVAEDLARVRQSHGYRGVVRILDRASGRTLMEYSLSRGARSGISSREEPVPGPAAG